MAATIMAIAEHPVEPPLGEQSQERRRGVEVVAEHESRLSDGAAPDGGGVAVRARAEATPIVAAMIPISTTASRINGRRSPSSVIRAGCVSGAGTR